MADIFDVIADGTRRDILQFLLARDTLGDRGTSVSQIVNELGVMGASSLTQRSSDSLVTGKVKAAMVDAKEPLDRDYDRIERTLEKRRPF